MRFEENDFLRSKPTDRRVPNQFIFFNWILAIFLITCLMRGLLSIWLYPLVLSGGPNTIINSRIEAQTCVPRRFTVQILLSLVCPDNSHTHNPYGTSIDPLIGECNYKIWFYQGIATIRDEQIKNYIFKKYSNGSVLDVCFISQGIVYDERNLNS